MIGFLNGSWAFYSMNGSFVLGHKLMSGDKGMQFQRLVCLPFFLSTCKG